MHVANVLQQSAIKNCAYSWRPTVSGGFVESMLLSGQSAEISGLARRVPPFQGGDSRVYLPLSSWSAGTGSSKRGLRAEA